MPEANVATEDFSLDQFKENNAQLQAILMQLQTTPAFNEQQYTGKSSVEAPLQEHSKQKASAAAVSGASSGQNQQLSSAPTGESGVQVHRSDRSKHAGTMGANGHHEVSQFSYVQSEEAFATMNSQPSNPNSGGGHLPGSAEMAFKNNPAGHQQMPSHVEEVQTFAPNGPTSQQYG